MPCVISTVQRPARSLQAGSPSVSIARSRSSTIRALAVRWRSLPKLRCFGSISSHCWSRRGTHAGDRRMYASELSS